MRTVVLALLALAPTALAHPDTEVCPIGGTLEVCAFAHEDAANPGRSEAGAGADLWLCCSYGALVEAERTRYVWQGTQYDYLLFAAAVYGTPTGGLTLLAAGFILSDPLGARDPSAFACVQVHGGPPLPCATLIP